VDVAKANTSDYDAVILPGGFGAAKNLSDFAWKGVECVVQPDVLRFVQAMHAAGKPVGLICIAPALTAHLIGAGARCTIGHDANTAAAINAMGAVHVECPVEEACVDEKNKLVTTPAYMLAGRIGQAYEGIGRLVDRVLAMA
jgi:enhancing lycopene biosynthesis protein 2